MVVGHFRERIREDGGGSSLLYILGMELLAFSSPGILNSHSVNGF